MGQLLANSVKDERTSIHTSSSLRSVGPSGVSRPYGEISSSCTDVMGKRYSTTLRRNQQSTCQSLKRRRWVEDRIQVTRAGKTSAVLKRHSMVSV